ncbi:type II toxin-antitoxin system PemK/MazF family toxin [Lysinibacillus xylanilyticus]|uniref:type II toxin-antitoxin system PemK/MazF family toxin n=1 Tax=Lysinibacillus xylanilyticus TaxID=582475 RepID=UPI003CFE8775
MWIYKDQQGKRRPGVIVGVSNVIAEIDVTVSKITSQKKRDKWDIFIENWKEIGLNKPSVVRCTKLSTIRKDDLIFKAAVLDEETIQKISQTIIKYFT